MKKIIISLTLILSAFLFLSVASHANDFSGNEKYWINSGDVFDLFERSGKGCHLYSAVDDNGYIRCTSCSGKSSDSWFPTVTSIPKQYDIALNGMSMTFTLDAPMAMGGSPDGYNGYVSVAWVTNVNGNTEKTAGALAVPDSLLSSGYLLSGQQQTAGFGRRIWSNRMIKGVCLTLLPSYNGTDGISLIASHAQIVYNSSDRIDLDLPYKVDLSVPCTVSFEVNENDLCSVKINGAVIAQVETINLPSRGCAAFSAMSASESVCYYSIRKLNGYAAGLIGSEVYKLSEEIGKLPQADLLTFSQSKKVEELYNRYLALPADEKALVDPSVSAKLYSARAALVSSSDVGYAYADGSDDPVRLSSSIHGFAIGAVKSMELLSGAMINNNIPIGPDQTLLLDDGSVLNAFTDPAKGARIEIAPGAYAYGFGEPGIYTYNGTGWDRFEPDFSMKGATVLRNGNELAQTPQSLKFGTYIYKTENCGCITGFGTVFIPAAAAPGYTAGTITLETPNAAVAASDAAPGFDFEGRDHFSFTAALNNIPIQRSGVEIYARAYVTYKVANTEITVYHPTGLTRSVTGTWNNILALNDGSYYDTVTGPVPSYIEFTSNNSVNITFADCGRELLTDTFPVSGFSVMTVDSDNTWLPAYAEITGIDTVTVSRDGGVICGVRYSNGSLFSDEIFEDAEDFTHISSPGELLADDVTVASCFGNNMILAAGKPVRIFGSAPSGENGKNVKVSIAGRTYYGKVTDGSWSVTADPVDISTHKYTLNVLGKNRSYYFNGVMFGNVYLLIGSDNADQTISEMISDDPATEAYINRTRYPGVRVFGVSASDMDTYYYDYGEKGTDAVASDVYHSTGWLRQSDPGLNAFSAYGYMLACELSDRSGSMPAAVISVTGSGAHLSAFSSNSSAFDSYSDNGLFEDTVYGTPSRWMFNQLIAPLTGGSYSGIIWYSGENDGLLVSDSADRSAYTSYFTKIISDWRNRLSDPDIPVFMIELPPLDTDDPAYDYGALRSEMGRMTSTLDNAYIVPTSSTGMSYSVRDDCKFEIAALTVDSIIDGMRPARYLGFSLSGSTATVRFDRAVNCSYPNNIKGFEVYSLGNWLPASAKLTADGEVEVYCPDSFTGIRYNAKTEGQYPVTASLFSGDHLPVPAFSAFNIRSDGTPGHIKITASAGWDIYKTTSSGYGYRYGPSMITNDDGTIDVWYSHTGMSTLGILDYASCARSGDGGRTWGKEVFALAPTALTEDKFSICDPEVIYFGGYYYIGYTSTLHKDGIANSVYVARSRDPEGPYEKWNGSGWGGDIVKPLIYFDGDGTSWGYGEPAFIELDGKLFIYYTEKSSRGNMTRVAVANAADENWPATVVDKGVALYWGSPYCAFDMAYDENSGIFIAISVDNTFERTSAIAVYESRDGLRFNGVHRIKQNILEYCSNCGISTSPNGHIVAGRQTYIAYAYNNSNSRSNSGGWGRWSTYMQPVTIELTPYCDFSGENFSTTAKTVVTAKADSGDVGITTNPLFFSRALSSGSFEIPVYLIRNNGRTDRLYSGVVFTGYDTGVVSINGFTATPKKAGRTTVTAVYGGYTFRFPIVVYPRDTYIGDNTVAEWYAPKDEYTVSIGRSYHNVAIRGILLTTSGLFGEAYNQASSSYVTFPSSGYPVEYTVADTSVCTVDQHGIITPIAVGATTVDVCVGNNRTFTVTVTVKE